MTPDVVPRWLVVGDGRSVHVQRFTEALAAAGVDTHLATFGGNPIPGVSVHALAGRSNRKRTYLAAASQLRRLVRELKPDVVNGQYLSSYGLLAALSGHRTLVQTTWGSDVLVTARRPLRRLLAKYALRNAVLATGDSTSLLSGICELAPAIASHRFVFGPSIRAFAARGSEDRRVILSPRAHEPLYNIDVILDAWPLVAAELPEHALVIAGIGTLTPALRARAAERVHFVGQIDHNEMSELLLSTDVVISIPDQDATSASVLEALAAGCTVVATDVDAAHEWLDATCLIARPPVAPDVAITVLNARGAAGALDEQWALERQIEHLLDRVATASSR